ncbi:MAG: 23S rRNA (uracil(1939)-C(5))-methyltransferase RlmD [Lachnospiraceae bacterium]|nr:23S rRNA (uracil(1939)-C(5))-methyltransferase RlmD [Lachnospiraceae bacterium]
MQKNDMIELTITDLSVEGSGIGKFQGMTFFVKDTVIGDVIFAKIMKLKKNYGYARLMEIKESSPNRVEPHCVYARACGGCQLQQMSYESQLAFKEKKIRDNLIRLGGFSKEELYEVMEPVVGMEHPFGYRNKAQFPVGYDRDGNVVTGFYAGRTHNIIPNTDCALGVPVNRMVLETVLSYMRAQRVSAYQEATGKGLVRHVLIRCGFDSKEIMVCLVINGRELPGEGKLAEMLKKIPGMTSISLNVNTQKTNVILGRETRTIWGRDTIKDALYLRNVSDFSRTGKKTVYQISPQSFYQVNPLQTEKLYSLVLDYAALTGKETVWDLYCGIGTISLFLAANARKVYGVEIVPKAVEDARENARLNGIGNAEFFLGKAEEVLPEFYGRAKAGGAKEDMLHPDVIVVDPPRKGCDEKCLDTMLKMRPGRIVYVSCDSATLARDLRVLKGGGYEVRKVRGVDQFGETVHVETVCLLSKLHEAKHHVKVKLDMDEMDITSAESKATYEEIKKYVAEHNDGMKVSNLYIAQVKRKCGIELAENFNLPKSEDARQPRCPKEKEEAIVEALKAFQMI